MENFNYGEYEKEQKKIEDDFDKEIKRKHQEINEEIKKSNEDFARKKEVLLNEHKDMLVAFANKGELELAGKDFQFIFNAPVKIYIKDCSKCKNKDKNKE